jgi:hypothetical protein
VSTANGEQTGLESAIAGVYGGPLDGFIQRRDALAKELRAAGRRDDASAVKQLRKPSRMAWALDVVALEEGAIDAVNAAVDAVLQAQAAGGDVRGAIAELRVAVRDFAGRAARVAGRAGHRLDDSDVANALLAVLASPDAFGALRGGHLADVPEAGGLDFLSSLPTPADVRPTPAVRKPAAPATATSAPAPQPAEKEVAAREAARQAAIALAAARERSEEAQRALRESESNVQAAEERLRRAEAEARAVRDERDRVRQETEKIAAELREAERASAQAELRLADQ